jgi:hypothetical protein
MTLSASASRSLALTYLDWTRDPNDALNQLYLHIGQRAVCGFTNAIPRDLSGHGRLSAADWAALEAQGYRLHRVDDKVLRVDW